MADGIEESTGTSDRRTAEEIRAKREAEIHRGQKPTAVDATATFAEAALKYLENGGSRKFIEPVIKYFGTKPLSKIDYAAIEAGSLKVFPNVKGSTRNRSFFTPTMAVLNHAAKLGLCTVPVVSRPKASPGKIRWITEEEAERLIQCSAPHLRPLLIFLLYTGARAGEALWLNWKDVNLAKAHVSFEDTKTDSLGECPSIPGFWGLYRASQSAKERSLGGQTVRPTPDPPEWMTPQLARGSRLRSKAACRRAGIRTSEFMIAGTLSPLGTTKPTGTLDPCSA